MSWSHHVIVASCCSCIHSRIASLGHVLDFHVILLCRLLLCAYMVDLHGCGCIFHFMFIYVAYIIIYHFLLVHVTLFAIVSANRYMEARDCRLLDFAPYTHLNGKCLPNTIHKEVCCSIVGI